MAERAFALEAGRAIQRRLVGRILLEPHHARACSFRGGVCSGLEEPNSATCGTPKAAATCISPESLLTTGPAAGDQRERLRAARSCPPGSGTCPRPRRRDLLAQIGSPWRSPAAPPGASSSARQFAEMPGRPALGRPVLGAGREHDVTRPRASPCRVQHRVDLRRRQGCSRGRSCSSPSLSPLSAE